jgi:hypothetical protein
VPYPTPQIDSGATTVGVPPFWLTPAAYWQPEHIVTSAWLEHAPFAFWLMEQLRPKRVVELGTHFGFSMFVFAEAAKRLGLDARLSALDSWSGDDQAGYYGDEVFDSVMEVAARDYPTTIELVRGYFADSRGLFEDASVDLLHIDGRHGYEDVREDFEAYRSTVRSGGIVLFHDIAERTDGFGVWRLWEELAKEYPTFAFEHGHGLGVLAAGEQRTTALEQLFHADSTEAQRIRADFVRLGSLVSRRAELETMPAEIDSLHAVVEMLRAENGRLDGVIRARDATIREIWESTSWKVTRPIRTLGRAAGRLRG